ncbi:polysaccharide deacetylase [Bacillus sp. A17A.1]
MNNKRIMILMLFFVSILVFLYVFRAGVAAKNEPNIKHNVTELKTEEEEKKKKEKNINQEKDEIQNKKIVYLTFDDGPGIYTQEVLSILKKENIKATFFVIGPHAEKFPNLIKSETDAGHYVGLHSMTHDYKKLYTQGEFVSEMKQVQQILQSIIQKNPVLCRPPYGSKPGLTQNLRDETSKSGFKIWDWTIDSLDWKYNKMSIDESVPKIVENVVSQANHEKEVILMHDIHPQSVKALPVIIQALKSKEYIFKAYSEKEHMTLNFWHDNRL